MVPQKNPVSRQESPLCSFACFLLLSFQALFLSFLMAPCSLSFQTIGKLSYQYRWAVKDFNHLFCVAGIWMLLMSPTRRRRLVMMSHATLTGVEKITIICTNLAMKGPECACRSVVAARRCFGALIARYFSRSEWVVLPQSQ